MAHDRYDRERGWRDDRPDFSERGQRGEDRDRDFGPGREERGFFGRMGDEFRSWFGDERDSDWDDRRERSRFGEPRRPREWNRSNEQISRGYGHDRDRGYRPLAGDYSRSGSRDLERREREWDRDPYRRSELAGSAPRSNRDDTHYEEWRMRQMEGLDRDYDDYRRERQSHFEDDFGSWRQRRQSKRELLRGIREHTEVVGSDDKHVGTVDRVAGDRIILTRSDPQSGGVHHSLSCSDIDRVEGDRIILECNSEKARERWRDEDRERALFEREDQGRAGPHVLDRSFSGTYR